MFRFLLRYMRSLVVINKSYSNKKVSTSLNLFITTRDLGIREKHCFVYNKL